MCAAQGLRPGPYLRMRQIETDTLYPRKAKTTNLTEAHKSFCSLVPSQCVGLPTLPASSPRSCEQAAPLTATFIKLHISSFPYAAAPDMN